MPYLIACIDTQNASASFCVNVIVLLTQYFHHRPQKPLDIKNNFAGLTAIEEAEKQAKRDVKRAVKVAQLEKKKADELAANPALAVTAKTPAKIVWADEDDDDEM